MANWAPRRDATLMCVKVGRFGAGEKRGAAAGQGRAQRMGKRA
jgi:hypothetical protein